MSFASGQRENVFKSQLLLQGSSSRGRCEAACRCLPAASFGIFFFFLLPSLLPPRLPPLERKQEVAAAGSLGCRVLTVLRLVLRAVVLQLLAAAVAALAGLQRLLEETLGLHDGGGLLLGQQDVGRRTAAARGERKQGRRRFWIFKSGKKTKQNKTCLRH